MRLIFLIEGDTNRKKENKEDKGGMIWENQNTNLMKTIKEQVVGCTFCEIDPSRITNQNTLAFVTPDKFPVTRGHILIIPKRHVEDFFGLVESESSAIYKLILEEKAKLSEDESIEGYNIGANCGEVAGQTVFHCHVHLIPRRKGDVKNPRGGVRHVISGKGDYKMHYLLKSESL